MKIEISLVTPEGILIEGEVAEGVLGLDPKANLAEPTGPVACSLWAWKQPGELFIRGTLRVPVRFQCATCGAFFSTWVEDSGFLRDYLIHEGQAHVDITDDVREAVLLALPVNPRCRPDCRGLCPQCGANRNEKPCGCPAEAEPGPWSALNALNLGAPKKARNRSKKS